MEVEELATNRFSPRQSSASSHRPGPDSSGDRAVFLTHTGRRCSNCLKVYIISLIGSRYRGPGEHRAHALRRRTESPTRAPETPNPHRTADQSEQPRTRKRLQDKPTAIPYQDKRPASPSRSRSTKADASGDHRRTLQHLDV